MPCVDTWLFFHKIPVLSLDILPCSNMRFQDTIKVFWVGKCQPSEDDLKPYLLLRKNRVLRALQWLVAHNKNYDDLAINYPLLSSWPDEFIPPQIATNVTYLNEPDHKEVRNERVTLQVWRRITLEMTFTQPVTMLLVMVLFSRRAHCAQTSMENV